MGARQPDLYPVSPNRSNVLATETYTVLVTYGSSAVASAEGFGGVGVEDTSAGKITWTFPRTYKKLVGFKANYLKCQAGAVLLPVILTNAISTAGSNGGGSIVTETRTEAGTATDPASGDVIEFTFVVTNDVVNDNRTITVTAL